MLSKASAAKWCLFVLACLTMLPAAAYAQSAIGGQVTDNTGGVLPGVSVDACSPAIIEGCKVGVTDSRGRYLIVELRPGTYRITFSLPGFSTVIREGLGLPPDFTATVNAQLQVGAIEESVTVTGESPVVDVQRTQRQQVLTREVLDAVPAAHNFSGRGQLIPGVRLSTPEVGAARAMQNTYMTVHGSDAAQNVIEVDGMPVTALTGDGSHYGYNNDQMAAETTYETGASAEATGGGGVRVNVIPREGGNTFSGSTYMAGAKGSWQSDNFTEKLRDLGLTGVNKIDRIYEFDVSQGGPILQDRLWFFGSYRRYSTNRPVADSFYKRPDGSPDYSRPGVDDTYIQNGVLRLTWQASRNNKLSAYKDRGSKEAFHEHLAGDDIETASRHWVIPVHYSGQVKWTSTASTRMLFEAGYSTRIASRVHKMQEGIQQEPFTPAWFAMASRVDRTRGTRTTAPLEHFGTYSQRFVYQIKLSYVTGTHAFRVGLQQQWGGEKIIQDNNAHLEQEYRNGVPESVNVGNYPIINRTRMNYDRALFAQDSWTLGRLTVNAGARLEWLNSGIGGADVPGGRFAPSRRIEARDDLPDWADLSPRLGLAYDVFGDGKTALKFSANRYVDILTTSFADRYNPLARSRVRLPWTDLNGDDIAQEGEFEPNLLPSNFGKRSLSTPDPDIERTWDLLTMVGVEHELFPRVSVGGAWFHRAYYDLTQSNNVLRSLSDYHPVKILNPLDGSPITVYNLNSRSLLAQVDIFDTNAAKDLPDHPYAGLDRSETYNALELSYNARLRGGGGVFGGWTIERTVSVDCDSLDDPNTFRFCNTSGFDAASGVNIDIPFRQQFKISGNYPLPHGFRVSGSFQSYDGRARSINWILSSGTRYPSDASTLARVGISGVCNGCEPLAGQRVIQTLNQPSITVRLDPPGERYFDRQNLLDISVGKRVTLGQLELELLADVFNVLNVDTAVTERNQLGPTFGVPTTVIDGRYFQLGAGLKW